LQYFALVFLQLQLAKIWCKLIIICVNYEKKQEEVLFMKHGVESICAKRFRSVSHTSSKQANTC